MQWNPETHLSFAVCLIREFPNIRKYREAAAHHAAEALLGLLEPPGPEE